MTYVKYINCHKWRNVGLIGVWCLATIGLVSGIYGLMNYTSFGQESSAQSCWKSDYFNYYDLKLYHTNSCIGDGGFMLGLEWFVALLANGGNIFYIWHVVNKKYKLIEIRCGKRPSSAEVDSE